MRKMLFLFCCGIGLLCCWSDRGSRCWGASPDGRPALPEQIRPNWQVGQSWVVETTRKIAGEAAGHSALAVRWQFTVVRREFVAGHDCFRVKIACRNAEDVPGMTIWVDTETLALRQMETGLLVQGEIRWVRERYDAQDAAGSPVIGLPGSLPLDLPVFSSSRSPSGRYGYQAVVMEDDDRAADDLAFDFEIEQSVKPVGMAEATLLIGDAARGDDKTPAMYDVRLRSNVGEVRQLWRAGQPWPTYSSNGDTATRLVSVSGTVPLTRQSPPRTTRRAPVTRRAPANAGSSMSVGGVDEGQSRFKPWSGSWFPVQKGGLISQLRKYDQLTGKKAAAWEQRFKPRQKALGWTGYCHAWSAAAVMEREPRAPRTVKGPSGKSMVLSVGDQKALLTICHYEDKTVYYGQRFDGQPGNDPQDIYPDVLWKYLRQYVKQRGIPLIVDIDSSKAIWNHPVYRYRITHRPHTTPGLRLGTMTLWMADDNVGPNYVGTKVKTMTYQFTFRMNGNSLVMGSARWYGAARKKHPDFAWYPTMVRPKNPYINPTVVRRMLGFKNPSAVLRPTSADVGELREVGAE